MGYNDFTYKCDDCPVCGKPEGAHMSKSVWYPFNGSACSDECGERAKAMLGALYASKAYKAIQARIWAAQDKLAEMERAEFDALLATRQKGTPDE